MATINLGLLKINTDNGLAVSFGNGNVYHIPLPGQKRSGPARQGAYGGEYDDGIGVYDDDGYRRSSYDRYDDDPYAGYANDGYGGGDYADDGYSDDGYSDDGYSGDSYGGDDYGRGGYADDDDYGAPYDDRYGNEDAGDYADGGNGGGNPVLNFIEDNDWVTYVLLVLLPPLGIYLLWRRQMFDYTTRWAVSAISGVWCVVVLILLFSAVLSGPGDATATPLNMGTVVPAQTQYTPEATNSLLQDMTGSGLNAGSGNGSGSAVGTLNGGDGISPAQTMDLLAPDASPSATPLPGYSGSGTNTLLTAGTVLVTATGPYYHNNPNCSYLQTGEPTSKLTVEVAQQRSKTPCPECFPGQTIYYHTANGKYYHLDKDCNMTNATPVTEEQAKAIGQTACPVCVTHQLKSLDATKGLVYCDENTTDRSGINVYCTENGKNFHVRSDCRDMKNAKSVGLLKAMLAGKTACDTCCPTAGRLVWFTANGDRFHAKQDCDGMQNAHQATVAEALVMGKAKCKICMGNVDLSFSGNGEKAATANNDAKANGDGGNAATTAGGVYVYANPGGKYYHTKPTCTDMPSAQRVLLSTMLKEKRQACPVCAKGADTVVYATPGGTYYHSYATCTGMTGAVQGTLAQAMAAGKKRCPDCWKSTSGNIGNQSATQTTNTANGQNTNAANGQNTNTAANNNNNNNNNNNKTNAANIKASGTFVYATKTSKHYHTNANCSGMTNADRIDLAVAVYYGKTACTTCAPAANKYVYSSDDGDYFHAKSSCGTMKNGKRRTVQSALLLGQKKCPVCEAELKKNGSGSAAVNGAQTNTGDKPSAAQEVSNVQAHSLPQSATTGNIVSSGTYTAGQSGVKVYTTKSDKYFHGYRQHAGNDAVQISLETAMNAGKTACPTCLKAARTTVYAVRGGRYYHSSKKCAGTGAVAGKLASALGYGLDACPVCVTRTKKVTNSNTYKVGTSGIKVWSTLWGNHFHSDKSCAGAGATHVTLETAINYGKTPCPNCASFANYKVYSSQSDKYYHSSREHAGSGATSYYWAIALAMGKQACPVCIAGSEAYEDSDIQYSASADTQVYVDIDSSVFYYHKAASCSDGGMSNGTGVALEFAVNWGYHACPYCNPPTSVK